MYFYHSVSLVYTVLREVQHVGVDKINDKQCISCSLLHSIEGHPSFPSTLKNRAFVKHRSEISNSACTDPKIVQYQILDANQIFANSGTWRGGRQSAPSSHYATLESQPVPLGGPAGSLFQKLPCFLLSQKARELSQCVDTVRSAPWILPSHVSLTFNTTSHFTNCEHLMCVRYSEQGLKNQVTVIYYSYITFYY